MQARVASNKCLPQLHSRNLHLLKLPSQTGVLCQSLCREQLLFHLFLLLGSLQHEYLGNISCSVEIKFKKKGGGCQRPLSFIFLCRNFDFSDYMSLQSEKGLQTFFMLYSRTIIPKPLSAQASVFGGRSSFTAKQSYHTILLITNQSYIYTACIIYKYNSFFEGNNNNTQVRCYWFWF